MNEKFTSSSLRCDVCEAQLEFQFNLSFSILDFVSRLRNLQYFTALSESNGNTKLYTYIVDALTYSTKYMYLHTVLLGL